MFEPKRGFEMHLIRQADGKRPTEYAVVSAEKPRAWRWDHGGGGYSALGRTPEEAECLLRDAIAYGPTRAPVLA